MPVPVHTDDPIYGLPAKWYGPGGSWQGVRYPALGLVIGVTIVSTIITVSVASSVMFVVKLAVGLALGLAVGVFLARKIFRHVDEWMPLVGWVEAITDELFTPQHPTGYSRKSVDLGEVTR